jgi:hypothetical protein
VVVDFVEGIPLTVNVGAAWHHRQSTHARTGPSRPVFFSGIPRIPGGCGARMARSDVLGNGERAPRPQEAVEIAG